MKKRWPMLTLPILLLCGLLTGCFFRGVDELYAVPRPPQDYEALQVRLNEVAAQGGEYAAPLSGEMIQSVQLQDLDGDGTQEAIAFFRLLSDEKPLKIYIFRLVGEEYQTMTIIEGAGTAINCVDYVQMDDSPFQELVVSWQISDKVHSLAAYSVDGGQAEELLRTDYESYVLSDLDRDNQRELVVLRTPSGEAPRAELYDMRGVLTMAGTAPLSAGVTDTAGSRVQAGFLADQAPAVFVTTNRTSDTITDIFVCQDGQLKNVTLDPETGESAETVRFYNQIQITDINGDGVLEIPQPVPLPEYRITTTTVNFWLIRWRQFDANGVPGHVFTTYHNERDDWYFILPDEWEGHLILSRSDLPGGGERGVTFYRWEGEEIAEPQPFLTIYRLTGGNRTTRSRMGQRFLLTPEEGESEVLYAAEFRDGWDCGLTEEDVRERFSVIKTDWYSGS